MALPRRQFLAGLGAAALGALPARADEPPDVLFVVIDDLNDWVGVLGGHVQARTPRLDRLAARGTLFTNAHCAAPLCNPSRTALLTGRRPSSTGIYANPQPFRPVMPDVVTLPERFARAGWRTYGCGKIFHRGDPGAFEVVRPDACHLPRPGRGWRPPVVPANGLDLRGHFDWGAAASPEDAVQSDARVADQVIAWLREPSRGPRFIACGFFRPHLPWYVPRAWFDAYPLDQVVLPVVRPDDLADVPMAGRRLAKVQDHARIVGSGKWAEAVQAYLASLSFTDAQLGRVLDALDRSPRGARTVVVLCADHGWSLGEKQHWRKSALWEECTRVPLVVVAPGVTRPGSRSARAVNLVDVYPTLVELCGLGSTEGLEGESLVPLLHDPEAPRATPSLTTHERGNHAVRDDRWRYIRYADGSEELYDHAVDPHEWHNRADDPAAAEIKATLARWLPAHDAPSAPRLPDPCDADDVDED